MESLRGRLLVATPELVDPSFARSVVLVLEHGEGGALGVVLNRPTDAGLVDALPGWADLATSPAVAFVGGPVQPEAAIGLVRLRRPFDVPDRPDAPTLHGDGPSGVTALFGGLATVDLDGDPVHLVPHIDALRVFVGYAGWVPDQLDDEVAADGWYVVDAAPDDPWSVQPDRLWRSVLRRQRGALRLVAGFPDDPSLN